MAVADSHFLTLENSLLNRSGTTPLAVRFRALFTLKSIGDERAISIISAGFKDESALLKHELAYVLGQMHNVLALPTLNSVLENKDEDPMVRHEVSNVIFIRVEDARELKLGCHERPQRH